MNKNCKIVAYLCKCLISTFGGLLQRKCVHIVWNNNIRQNSTIGQAYYLPAWGAFKTISGQFTKIAAADSSMNYVSIATAISSVSRSDSQKVLH